MRVGEAISGLAYGPKVSSKTCVVHVRSLGAVVGDSLPLHLLPPRALRHRSEAGRGWWRWATR